MRVYVRHCRMVEQNTYCSPGIRLFFKRHNLDLADFIKNGIAAQALIDTGDTMALRVVEAAMKEAENGQ